MSLSCLSNDPGFSPRHLMPRRTGLEGLEGEIHIRMHDTHMSRQRIIPTERLLLRTQVTPHFLLPTVIHRLFVSRQIVASAEDGVTWFAGAGV